MHQAQSREISNQLASLKKERQTELDTQIIRMLEDVRHLKATLDELEDPLESFDEKLFMEIIKEITISRADEMEMTIIGGLKFTELI